jgi:hypothetical protein
LILPEVEFLNGIIIASFDDEVIASGDGGSVAGGD